MDANAVNPRELFDSSTIHYEIPIYQRPYVWSQETQWEPLWSDIENLAELSIEKDQHQDKTVDVYAHFLGAIVLKAKSAVSRDVTRFEVVDGQQRMTTLQILLSAGEAVLARDGRFPDEAEALSELTRNSANRFKGNPEELKLRPSAGDLEAFGKVMRGELQDELEGHRIAQAHRYFRERMEGWLFEEGKNPDPSSVEARIKALTDVLETKLQVVSINLDDTDDDHLIFETLNDRGTPLLKADLIKNWIFSRSEKLTTNVKEWAARYWDKFDEDWWREETRQGRLRRSRIDIFFQYWLTMQLNDEVQSEAIFAKFRGLANELTGSKKDFEELLSRLRQDADRYRELFESPSDDAAGRFYRNVIRDFDLAVFTPLLLRFMSPHARIPEAQVNIGLGAVESWVVRRALMRATSKNTNRLVVTLLQDIADIDSQKIGEGLVSALLAQSSEATYWPTDEQLIEEASNFRVYGWIKRSRLVKILLGAEQALRTERHEQVRVSDDLELEHIFPVQWRAHWDTVPPRSEEEARKVEAALHRLGNLTVITGKLNGSLSNRPWTDTEARTVAPTGPNAGIGKRALISTFSLLALNKEIVDHHESQWTVDDIDQRSRDLLGLICKNWPRPE